MSSGEPAFFTLLQNRLREAGDPEIATGQAAYMRDQFEFYGVKTPERNALLRELVREMPVPDWGGPLEDLVHRAFDEPQRELHYSALWLIERTQKNSGPAAIELLEELIGTNSWWDTVDWLAKLVGNHFTRFPDQTARVTERWMASGELWLQRVAIIFQLRYKAKTDVERMFRYIRQVADSREFFLQKAAGWALRQHAKTDPEVIADFLAKENLPALTRREAQKQLTRMGY